MVRWWSLLLRVRLTLAILLAALCSAHCATKAVREKAKHTPVRIQTLDSVAVGKKNAHGLVAFYAPELRSDDGKSYAPAKNALRLAQPDMWLQLHSATEVVSDQVEEITKQGGFYLGAEVFYLSPELPQILRVSHPIFEVSNGEVYFLDLEDGLGVGLQNNSGMTYYRLREEILSRGKTRHYGLEDCSECHLKIRKKVKLARQYIANAILVSIVDNRGNMTRLYRIHTEKYGYFSDRYAEIYEIHKIQPNYLWYPVFPFAFVWDVATFPIQALWEIMKIRAFSRSFS